MHSIPTDAASNDFAEAWHAAGRHLQRTAESYGLQPWWLRQNLHPPFLEHLSFRLGGELFFVRLEGMSSPGSLEGLIRVANGCKGFPCLMPMLRSSAGWMPVHSGWGLLSAAEPSARLHSEAFDPRSVLTGQVREMTDWEMHDFAVQQVRQHLEHDGRQVMSSQGDPEVDPSLWFVGPNGPEWVVVRAVRYPETTAPLPRNLAQIATACSRLSRLGNFASVAVASAGGAAPTGILPRGGPMHVRFSGLEPLG